MKHTDDILNHHPNTFEDSIALVDSLKSMLKLNNSFLEMLFNAIPNPIFYKDKDGIYKNCNDAFSKNILGIAREDIIGKSLYDFPNEIPKENADIYYQKDNELLEKKETQFYSAKVKCTDGIERHYNFYKAIFTSDDNEALGIVGIMLDITESEKQKAELEYLATIDPLTGLFNRRHFCEISKSILDLDIRNQVDTSMLILDIDKFKSINDTHGHNVGDKVLSMISMLFKKICRESDLISRWGGEEFVILLANTNSSGARIIAEKIREEVQGFIIDAENGITIQFTISIGISEVIQEDDSIKAAIYRADKALYEAKETGRNKVCIG